MNYKKYVVKYDDKTDMLSSLKKLSKKCLADSLEEFDCASVSELSDYLIDDFKILLDMCKTDIATHIFFHSLVDGEHGSYIVAHDSDIESFIVFLYEKDGDITYYIPDEIRKIIDEFLDN